MFSGEATKFFCPKCKAFYEKSQRFCPKDGTRLLPGLEVNKTQNIFTKALSQKLQERKEEIKTWQLEEDEDSILEIEPEKKTTAKLINPFKVPSGTVEPGDRTSKPLGREAFSPEKPRVLIGKTLKGRYQISNFIKQNPKNFVYFADDIITGKKVLIYIFYNEEFSDKILVEERISLSHTKHPNIAATVDSGHLQEGNAFLVIERPKGETLENKLMEKGHIEPLQVAKIIRQVAEALNEAHRNGILHRNLTPKNIFLTTNEKGTELVKVTEFAVAEGDDIFYLSPEQIEGKPATSASDIFSLGVIAYQLLTKRLPFQGESKKLVLESQKQGIKLNPSQLRFDISQSTDSIIKKALSYEPTQRYLLARDFGEALYNSLTRASSEEEQIPKPISSATVKAVEKVTTKTQQNQSSKKNSALLTVLTLIVLISVLVIVAVGAYIFTRNHSDTPATYPENQPAETKEPTNTLYFRNTKENLSEELTQNYRDFSFHYPNDWKIYPSKGIFVDVAKKNENGIPIEQFLVTFYISKGSFQNDREIFPRLTRETNQKLKTQLSNYRFLSEGETEINQKKAYEMHFEALDVAKGLKIFGRRIFLPAEGNKNAGLVITMLATSLSKEIKSSEDLGKKGGLKVILETFRD